MKHFKLFNSEEKLQSYVNNQWVSPHIFLNRTNKSLDYEEKFTPVEYISSTQTGGQYIDLGVHLFENTDDVIIDIKFNLKGGGKDYVETSAVNLTKPSVLIACISETDPYYGFVVRKADIGSSGTIDDTYVTMYTKWQISNSVLKNANGDQSGKTKYYPTYLAGNMSGYEQTRTGVIYEKRLIIDNLSTIASSTFNKMTNLEAYMFATYNNASSGIGVANNYVQKMWRFSEADVYYCKITKGTEVIRDLVPMINLYGIPGLYDKAHKKFYPSQGDQPFVAGPKI